MFLIVKSFFGSMRAKLGRLQFKIFLTRNLPGMYGVLIRSRLMQKHFASAGENLKIHEGFRFRNIHKVMVGNSVTIGVNAYIQAGGLIEIGDNSILSPNVSIWTHHHNYENVNELIQNQNSHYKNVVIGNDVWIGTGSIIEPGSIIGDGAVIRPGSVIDGKDVKPNTIMAGNPAQKIGNRVNPKNRMKLNIDCDKINIPNNPQTEEIAIN
ncbi:MAG: acyltransferase [candidate division Zixibacteria bacterium]|nr:acyltransferase [candidate division Zixibacteria bacterium]